MELKPHTVYILCGPTLCGKSTFANKLNNYAQWIGYTSAVLSSDEIRHGLRPMSKILMTDNRHIQDPDDGRHSSSMLSVSRQAFEFLFCGLKQLVAYPICTDIIIVDTTGFDERFRKEVTQIARDASYRVELITFEYKTRQEYFPAEAPDYQVFNAVKSLDRFRKMILPSLSAKDYDERIRIKSKTDWDEQFDTTGAKRFLGQDLDFAGSLKYLDNFKTSNRFVVIGDSHECVPELKQMITELEAKYPDDVQIVHVGDYLDKGGDTKAMVEFMYERMTKGDWIVQGNHESYAWKRFSGEITKPDLAMEKLNFSSVEIFKDDPKTLDLFKQIWRNSYPFLVIGKEGDTSVAPVVITHAPCANRHIGKMNSYSVREQRNFRVKDRAKFVSWFEELAWFYKEADTIFPLHFFGHVAHQVTKPGFHKFKNKFFLDTGCVYGNKLTGAVVHNGILEYVHEVQSTRPFQEDKLGMNLGFPPKVKREFDIEDYDLSVKDLRLIDQIERNGIRYVSGTMAPSASTDTELESLESAFSYYKNKGVTHLTLQSKWMGSRCQTYLFKDAPEKTFQVSRNGWKIRNLEGKTPEEYAAFLLQVYEENKHLFAENDTEVILDGELLPWRALGAGLIDGAFNTYVELVKDEVFTLKEDEGFASLTDFVAKLNVSQKEADLLAFEDSLSNYSQDTPPQYMPFDILYADGQAGTLVSNDLKFALVNKSPFVSVDLENPEAVLAAKEFFRTLTVDKKMEGVVVKPLLNVPGVAPYMKVRSPEYLRLVYGYDYTQRLEKLIRQKNINGKVQTSIREHAAATEMLTATGPRKLELIVNLLADIRSEQALDPRL